MNYRITGAISLVVFFAFSSAAMADNVVVNQADAGAIVTLHMGQGLVVRLNGTHGSGSYWRLDADLTPELVLSGRTTDAIDVPGAPETTIFSFATNAPGSLTFKASYVNPGRPAPKAADVAFPVNVVP